MESGISKTRVRFANVDSRAIHHKPVFHSRYWRLVLHTLSTVSPSFTDPALPVIKGKSHVVSTQLATVSDGVLVLS